MGNTTQMNFLIIFISILSACSNKNTDVLVIAPIIDEQYEPTITSTLNQNITVLDEGNAHPANAGTQYTSITTAPNGEIYSAWMDEKKSLRLLQVKLNGEKVQKVLRYEMQEDKYHVKPSIAVDKNGFIHIAADMHNQGWVYMRSINPNDIQAFEEINLPGKSISYPQFFKDKNNDLYITFRHKVKDKPNEYTKGSSGGGLIRYNLNTKSFVMLGGESHGFLRTLVWTNMGGKDGHYQQPGIRLFFDNSNRMHLVATLINNPTDKASDGNTHVLYAYSDDKGDSFYDINGKKINSLPMTPASMTTVAYRPESDISANAFVGAFSENRPVIGWFQGVSRDVAGRRIVRWNGQEWKNISPESGAGNQFVIRRNKQLIIFRPRIGLYFTNDEGRTYKKMQFSSKTNNQYNLIIDEQYFLLTGNIRFQSTDVTETKIFIHESIIN